MLFDRQEIPYIAVFPAATTLCGPGGNVSVYRNARVIRQILLDNQWLERSPIIEHES